MNGENEGIVRWTEIVGVCQAEDGIRDLVRSRGLGDVYKRHVLAIPAYTIFRVVAKTFLSEFKVIRKITEDLNPEV